MREDATRVHVTVACRVVRSAAESTGAACRHSQGSANDVYWGVHYSECLVSCIVGCCAVLLDRECH
jgi:hypothetical protein